MILATVVRKMKTKAVGRVQPGNRQITKIPRSKDSGRAPSRTGPWPGRPAGREASWQ